MSEKTEEATPKKLREARKRGEVPKSRELGTAAILLAVGGALLATASEGARSLRHAWDLSLGAVERVGTPDALPPSEVLRAGFSFGVDAMLPMVLAALLAGTLAQFLQVGPLLSFDAIQPKLERLNPVQGAKNLFSSKRLFVFLRSVVQLGIVGYVTFRVIRADLRSLVGLSGSGPAVSASAVAELVIGLTLRVGGAVLVLAVLDVFYQRWRFAKDQRMSKDEVKREYKDAEGDAQAKQARQRMHRELAEHSLVESVASADVLVVNPTHLAIALRYDEEEGDAPLVVAKGMDHLAQRMIAVAESAGVPVMRDVPLAHALFELETQDPIPEELFDAVAAVLHAAWAERDASEDSA